MSDTAEFIFPQNWIILNYYGTSFFFRSYPFEIKLAQGPICLEETGFSRDPWRNNMAKIYRKVEISDGFCSLIKNKVLIEYKD